VLNELEDNENLLRKIEKINLDSSKIELNIQDWVKNNARWWAEGKISDMDFVNGIQFLIKNGIIKV